MGLQLRMKKAGEIRIGADRKQFQIPRVAQANSVNFAYIRGCATFPGDAPLLYNIGENKEADSQRAAVDDVARRPAADIIDPLSDLDPRESPFMQNESILEKSACTWPEPGRILSKLLRYRSNLRPQVLNAAFLQGP